MVWVPTVLLLLHVHINIHEIGYPYEIDEPGEEMSEHARIWKIYNDEAAKFDSTLIEGWNRAMDVLLVFVSEIHCFSARM